MPLVSLKSVLTEAKKGGYAVGAFNAVSLEFLESIIEAAEEERAPVIVNLAEVHFPFVPIKSLSKAIVERANASSVPVVFNLDHGLSFESVISSIKNGVSSVMFDGSHFSYEENIEKTKEVVRACKSVSVSVEAEIGAVGGAEGGLIEGEANPDLFTKPDEAKEFVEKTGIDALAVAIGNVHGKYKGEPKIDFDLLAKIRDCVNIPLVLHGGSGISDSDFRKAVELGITKINFYTGMALGASEIIERGLSQSGGKYHGFVEILSQVRVGVKEIVRERIQVFGSAGKA